MSIFGGRFYTLTRCVGGLYGLRRILRRLWDGRLWMLSVATEEKKEVRALLEYLEMDMAKANEMVESHSIE